MQILPCFVIIWLCLVVTKLNGQTSQLLSTITGTISSSIVTVRDIYQWEITPSVSTTNIQIIFEALDNRQAELRIYDKASFSSGNFIWNCVSCGSVLPPPFFSTTGSVIVYFKAVSGVSFSPSSMVVSYIANTTAPNNSYKNLTVTLNMGYGEIIPYQVKGLIAAGSTQRWNVRPAAAFTQRITFIFSSLLLSAPCDDHLQIYDQAISASNLVFDSCTSDLSKLSTWLYARSGHAIILFRTQTSASTSSSFVLSYYTDTDVFNCGSFVQPDLLNGDTMLLTDGTSSSNVMRRGVTCTWLIAPYQGGTVSLIFDWVSLKFGSSVVVYDSRGPYGYVLWSGQGATLTPPPVITSSSSSLYVVYSSDTTDPVIYKGFIGKYQTNYLGSSGLGIGSTNLAMSSTLDIIPPGDGRTFTSGVNYTWYIMPSRSSGKIYFTFNNMNLSRVGDRVKIYDGLTNTPNNSLIAVYSSALVPSGWIMTQSSSATVIFETESGSASAFSNGNFQLAYYSDGSNYHCGFTRNPARLTMPSWIITDGSSSQESVYSGSNCVWDIEPYFGNISSVFIYFSRFSLTGGTLTISTGSSTSSSTYTVISETSAVPAPILLSAQRISISYTSNSNALGFGFSLTYYAVNNPYSFPGDNVVKLFSSSAYSLSAVRPKDRAIGPYTNLTWLILPSSSTGKIYFALSSLSLADCNASINILDGNTVNAPQLVSLCGSSLPSPYKWITTSRTAAAVTLTSDSFLTYGDFDISYYSDGPAYHCGFINNPAILTAPSFVLSDGSSSANRMYSNQNCQWIISPNIFESSTWSPLIIVDFLELDLAGGEIQVYLGSTSSGYLIWNCEDCSYLPSPLLIRSASVFIQYTSSASGAYGTGFTAIYWTGDANLLQDNVLSNRLLQVPAGFEMNSDVVLEDLSAYYQLVAGEHNTVLSSHAFYSETVLSDELSASSYDGRPSQSVFESKSRKENVCGILFNAPRSPILYDDLLHFIPTQSSLSYVKGLTDSKPIYKIIEGDESNVGSLLSSSTTCKFLLTSGSSQAINMRVRQFEGDGRLRVYAGVYGNDSVIFDSHSHNFKDQLEHNLTAPCGTSIIVYDASEGNSSTFRIDYTLLPDILPGYVCEAYIKSLLPPVKKADPNIPIYISLGAVGGVVLIILLLVHFNKLKARRGYILYPDYYNQSGHGQTTRKRNYVVITPSYPRYNAKWDNFRNNMFLRPGHCCVCKGHVSRVFHLKCNHSICLDCTKGYLESALGDISMFPVKCPMHYDACKGNIDARVAKRILSEVQYNRFIEFSDRSTYGDGIRCVHCNNYVNFPDDMNRISRAECPHCTQSFCIRCKKPWHYGGRCPLEFVDASLEEWKHRSGAQKCPGCKKLIEKDDPDTCNHMVHKITDGIPCVRDRTDFCYLCGEEVTSSYPHEEVINVGVNHFPEGVFQKCRTLIAREKQAEIDRIKRLKRLKNQNNINSPSRKATNQIAPTAEEWDDAATEINSPGFDSPMFSPSSSSRNNERRPAAPDATWLTETHRVQPQPIARVADPLTYDQFDREWDHALAFVQATAGPAVANNVIGPPPSSPTRSIASIDSPIGSPNPSQRLLGSNRHNSSSGRPPPSPLSFTPQPRFNGRIT